MAMILGNATLAAMTGGYALCDAAAVVTDGPLIRWAGPEADLPAPFKALPRHDLGGRLVTPALIDCHTHIVFAGHRAREFEMRLNGASYEQVARAGGGILSTVTATRAATEDQLFAQSLPRLDAILSEGVGTVEVKSGYGLDIETELRMLRTARRLAQARRVTIRTSFLGAHAIPPDHAGRPDDYLTDLALPALRAAHAEGLVDAVDAFCEGIAFSPAQVARVFDLARSLGLPVKLHAEQLSNLGGAALPPATARCLPITWNTSMRRACGHGRRRAPSPPCCPGPSIPCAKRSFPPWPAAPARRSDGGRHRLQPRLLAHDLAHAGDEHGLHLFRLTPEEALLGTTPTPPARWGWPTGAASPRPARRSCGLGRRASRRT
jgi:imidazolonepropionase